MQSVQVDGRVRILVGVALRGHLHQLIRLRHAQQILLPEPVADQVPGVAPAVAEDPLHQLPGPGVVLPHAQLRVRQKHRGVRRLAHAVEPALGAQDDSHHGGEEHVAHEDVDAQHGAKHHVQDRHAAVAGDALGAPGQRRAAAGAEGVEAQALHHREDHVDLPQEAEPHDADPIEEPLQERSCGAFGVELGLRVLRPLGEGLRGPEPRDGQVVPEQGQVHGAPEQEARAHPLGNVCASHRRIQGHDSHGGDQADEALQHLAAPRGGVVDVAQVPDGGELHQCEDHGMVPSPALEQPEGPLRKVL
mmetsp:Transcript_34640/g.83099  ORF Transcript_34640/g.83099 Transcript_34640/m.83099 type:complete len:304 (+) Transcript_34640:5024-5935(+)